CGRCRAARRRRRSDRRRLARVRGRPSRRVQTARGRRGDRRVAPHADGETRPPRAHRDRAAEGSLMELDFSIEDEELRDGVRAVLERECPMTLVRKHVEAVVHDEPSSVPTDLWKLFVSLDWPALTIDEEHGGVGFGTVELAVLAEELGRANVPGALLSTVA